MRNRRFGRRSILAISIVATTVASQLPGPAAVRSGPRLAYTAWEASGSSRTYSLNVVERDGSGRRQLVRTSCCIGGLSWAPDGSRIAYEGTGGSLLGEIRVVRADGSRNARLVALPNVSGPAWSPDGRRIAFEEFLPLVPVGYGFVGENHILVVKRDGSGLRPIAAGSAYSPTWSPNGARLAYENAKGIYVSPVEPAAPTRVSPAGVVAYSPAWSPDGRRIAFLGASLAEPRDYIGPSRIYIATPDGRTVRILRARTVCCLSWSPDSKRIAYAWSGISIVDVVTGRITRLTRSRGDSSPRWSPDGTEIAFIRGGRPGSLMVMRADGSSVRPIVVVDGFLQDIAWSRR